MTSRPSGRRYSHRILAGLASLLAVAGLVAAQGDKDAGKVPKAATANHYIGAEKCKYCHASETKTQYAGWQKTDHAKAFETLGTDAAKKFAKEKGIDDPQKSDKCLKCHETAFGVAADLIKKGFDPKAGVQCESCHGPGEQHMKARMAAAAKSDAPKADEYHPVPEGEIVVQVDQKTCLGCHNSESPTFKPFCYYERTAKIGHLDSRKPHPDAMTCGCGKCECKDGCKEGCGVAAKDKK
jgi:Cytochrome c554 and c-prime